MAPVSFDHITKRFGDDVVAVNDLDLQITDGEFMVLVGPSGCGKTTALRCLAGLEEISEGQLRIGNHVVNQVPAKDRNIAMVFQSYALYPHMTVFDNLAFALQLKRTPKKDIRRRVEEAAKILDIQHLLDRKPKALSGGQRQRVALGRAIVREPDVFLMDEPLSNLDAKLRVQTRAEILRLQRRLGTTTVYVTHDQVEAMTMGDRIAVMREGVLQQVGSPQALYENPVNLFVAAFIGSPAMNFLTVRVDGSGLTLGQTRLELPGGPAPAVSRRPSGSSLVLGFRPEHMTLTNGARGAAISIPAKVDVVEYLGHEELIHAQTEGVEIVALSEPHPSLRAGATVDFAVPVEKLHLFDPDTEERLIGQA
jgi:multiple sugar transport system ATP-binding protein